MKKLKKNKKPKLIFPDWKCNRLCTFGKHNWKDSNKTICKYITDEIIQIGIDKVTDKYIQKGNYVGGGKTQ